jgi:hypothetical protein
MHIEADLDPIHAERLVLLQTRLQKPLSEILAELIDLALTKLDNPVSPAYQILQEEGLIGCMQGDGNLSVDYKKHLWGESP